MQSILVEDNTRQYKIRQDKIRKQHNRRAREDKQDNKTKTTKTARQRGDRGQSMKIGEKE
jgi:hypothetical protein